MALMLRKACQPSLDEANLHEFHADIDPSSKNLVLFTPCGKRFAIVHGVVFGRLQPTNGEIEYAVSLLQQWLAKNNVLIRQYIEAWVEFKSMTEPEEKIKTDTYKLELYNHYHYGRGIKLTYKEIAYTFKKDMTLADVDITDALPADSWHKLITRPPATVMNATIKHLNLQHRWLELKKIVDTIHGQLNSCYD